MFWPSKVKGMVNALQKYFHHTRQIPTSVEPFNSDDSFDLKKLSVGKMFAQGAESHVYHGRYNDQHVAVKVIQVREQVVDSKRCLAQLEKQFNQEVRHLSRFNDPHVLGFIGAFRQEDVFCIVTEYLSEGSLRTYLNKLRSQGTQLTLQKVLVLGLEVARGMEHVHSNGIIHRDLKPENVLIAKNTLGFGPSGLKIADFGVSCEEYCSGIPEDDVGTYRWMAPEMIRRRKSCGRKADVYSFGLMLFEMVSGNIPFADMTPVQVAYGVVNKNLRPNFPEECPDPMKSLIEQCCSSDPRKRPEFCQIVKVLEQFEASLSHGDTLNLVPNCINENHHKKRSFIHWICKP